MNSVERYQARRKQRLVNRLRESEDLQEKYKLAIIIYTTCFPTNHGSGCSRSDGGPGSGNWGHKGRPGEIGGSAPSDGSSAASRTKAFGGTSTKNFVRSLSKAKETVDKNDRWRVDTWSAEELDSAHPNAKLHVSDGGSTVAVTTDGDIISLCHNKNDKETSGTDLLKMAVDNGGNKLDAFGGLYEYYTKRGFEAVSWTPFDAEQAPEGWTSGRDEEEPVIFYKYTGKSNTTSYDDFISNTKPYTGKNGYKDAGDARDKDMEG